MMRNIFKLLVATLIAGVTVAAATPADARPNSRWGDHRGWSSPRGWDSHRGWNRGWRQDHRHVDRFHRFRGYSPRHYYGVPRYSGYGYPHRHGYGRYHRYRDHDGSDALIAGIAGLAIGAAIASAAD